MTLHEYAEVLGRISSKLKKLPEGPHPFNRHIPAITDEDHIIGAAFLWMYLRGCFTASDKMAYKTEEILVILDIVSNDTEIWPSAGLLKQIADSMCADDEEFTT